MELRKQFNAQWHGIRDVVLSEAKRQLALQGRVDAGLLTARLHEETAKWQRGVLARGVWYAAFAEAMPDGAAAFSAKAVALSICEPAKNKEPSNGWTYALFLIMSAALGCVLHVGTGLSVVEQAFYPVLLFVVLQTLHLPVRNRRKSAFERRVLGDIDRQLDNMRQDLEECVK